MEKVKKKENKKNRFENLETVFQTSRCRKIIKFVNLYFENIF